MTPFIQPRPPNPYELDRPVVRTPCIQPTVAGYPCGRCEICRDKVRKMRWSRLMLEATDHTIPTLLGDMIAALFVTLTYDEEHLPLNEHGVPTLSRVHLDTFLRYLRDRFPGYRFEAAGEYGGQTGRPHFHLVLFGLFYNERVIAKIRECWKHGFIDVKPANKKAFGYILKDLSKVNLLPKRADPFGREPVFRTGTRVPMIGQCGVELIANQYRTVPRMRRYLERYGDISEAFLLGNDLLVLDGVMRRKVRAALDIPELARDRDKLKTREDYARPRPEADPQHIKNATDRRLRNIRSRRHRQAHRLGSLR